ncbi:MAG: hypothetical protein ACR2LC_01405 [Pyrinomonadaceae bacterium]
MQREDMAGQRDAGNDSDGNDMQLRRTTLADGRYMIFYTFDETPGDGHARTANSLENSDAMENDSQPTTEAHAKKEQTDV